MGMAAGEGERNYRMPPLGTDPADWPGPLRARGWLEPLYGPKVGDQFVHKRVKVPLASWDGRTSHCIGTGPESETVALSFGTLLILEP